MRIGITILLTFALLGCATVFSTQSSYRPYVTSRDWLECQAYGDSNCPMNPLIATDLRDQCLRMKGYRKRK